MILYGLIVVIQIALIVHVFYTRRPLWWAGILFFLPLIGGIVYLIVEILPGYGLFRTARKVQSQVIERIDPEREVRAAREALDLADTVGNRIRLAGALAHLGRWTEAEPLFRRSLEGPFADDPTVLMGLAQSLIELDRPQDALVEIAKLRAAGREGADVALLFARAAGSTGDVDGALEAYAFAAPRLPSLEAQARHVVFLRSLGRIGEADQQLADLRNRAARVPPAFADDARAWLALAEAG